jgi:2-keto-myo-inositol isomerase
MFKKKRGGSQDMDQFPFKMSLNASTLFPYKLGIEDQIRIAAEAGYEGIEIWVRDLEAYLEAGHSLQALKRYVSDTGITIANAIAFFKWADEDRELRAQGREQASREMSMLAEIGCSAVAAPPFGNVANVSLADMAEQYAKLVRAGRQLGVEPYLEFWGRAKKLSTLSEAVTVAMESGIADAKLLLDPFHMYTGGTAFEAVGYLNGSSIGIVHVNDYPSAPERSVITDQQRVFPAEGVAPSALFAQLLHEAGYKGFLSLELFIPDYGGASALEIAKRGLQAATAAYTIRS